LIGVGVGAFFVVGKIAQMKFHMKLPAPVDVLKIFARVRIFQFASIAESYFKESIASLKVIRWILSGAGGNVISCMLQQVAKQRYIELCIQDIQLHNWSDLKRCLYQNLGMAYRGGLLHCFWVLEDNWKKFKETKMRSKIDSWTLWRTTLEDALKFEFERLRGEIAKAEAARSQMMEDQAELNENRKELEIVRKLDDAIRWESFCLYKEFPQDVKGF